MNFRSTKVPACKCPGCGKRLDRASGLAPERAPRSGDITVCIGCTAVLCFAEDLSLRKVTSEELNALPVKVREKAHQIQWAIRSTQWAKPHAHHKQQRGAAK